MLNFVLFALSGCIQAPPTVPDSQATTIALSVAPFSKLQIPPNSRPHGPPDALIPIREAWSWHARKRKKKTLRRPVMGVRIPIRPRGLFFTRPAPGMVIKGPNGPIPHRYNVPDRSQPHWTANRELLMLHKYGGTPATGEITLYYPKAEARERALNYEWSGKDSPEDFVRTSVQVDDESLTGLLLPAPALANFDVTVPQAGELTFRVGIAPAETLDAPASDGATLRILVDGQVITQIGLEEAKFADHVVPLDKYQGKSVTLGFETQPGEDARFDYVMIAEPVLGSRKATPQNVMLVFIDTLRPDHMSAYGYARDTTPNTKAQAQRGVVFKQARSVAPWTLPSARAVVTGRHPEAFNQASTLQSALREKGFSTYMRAGNLYLGAKFGVHRHWGRHHVTLWPSATEVVDDTLAYLDAHKGHDTLTLIHFMDAHLPYQEGTYAPHLRRKWAGDNPEHLPGEEFHLRDVRNVSRQLGKPGKQYIQDRYDQNIRYVDEELKRLYDTLGDNDILVVFSDHGEEFWDHGGFEHGHTLYDELLRVPLIIRGPGLKVGEVTEPVSLLDVTPTVLDMVGVPVKNKDGVSLVAAANGDPAALGALAQRDQVFGRPLYNVGGGLDRWGVLHDDKKYTTHGSLEFLYDLGTDPDEKRNLLLNAGGSTGATYRASMQKVLGRAVGPVYRLLPTSLGKQVPDEDLVVTLKVPGGIQRVWQGGDPTAHSLVDIQRTGDTAVVTWKKGWRGTAEVYVTPVLPAAQVTHKLAMTATYGAATEEADPVSESRKATLDTLRTPLMRARPGARGVKLTWAIAPVPLENATELKAVDDELNEALKAMGYVHDDD